MLSDSEITRLIDIAYAGTHKGCVNEAMDIFDGVLEMRPAHVPALIGKAFAKIVTDDFENAEAILRNEVLAEHPDDADGLAFLGLCLFLSGRKDEVSEVLDRIPEGDGTASSLAARMKEACA